MKTTTLFTAVLIAGFAFAAQANESAKPAHPAGHATHMNTPTTVASGDQSAAQPAQAVPAAAPVHAKKKKGH